MSRLLILNIMSTISCLLLLVSNSLKDEKKLMAGQIISSVSLAMTNLFAGSITGASIDLMSIGRNALCMKNKLNKFSKSIIIGISAVIGLLANANGIIGLLPITANIINTAFMTNEIKRLKIIILITSALWLIHDFYMQMYVTSVIDVMNIITAAIFLFKPAKKIDISPEENTVAA